ncbi:MAG TPA: NlpC/P60 family protein [Acidimicrobiales bacterium]
MAVAVALVAGLAFAVTPLAAQGDEVIDKVRESQQIADQLDALNLRLTELGSKQEVARHQLQDAQAAAADAQARLDAANADLTAHQRQLASFSVEAYISGGGSARMDSLLGSPSQSAEVAASYIDTVGEKRQQIIDDLASTRNRIDSEAEHLSLAEADAKRLADQVDQASQDTDAALAEQKALQDKVTGELVDLVTNERERLAQEAAVAGQTQSVANDGSVTGTAPPQHPHAADVVKFALSKLGAPYIWAAAGPDTFDCSGLVLWAWALAGVHLDHYTGFQYAQTTHIAVADLLPGDLVFFWGAGETGDPGHVGLYIGNGLMVHAPHEGGNVMLSSIYYWPSGTFSASRVTDPASPPAG